MAEAIQTRTKEEQEDLNERLWYACRRGDNSEVEQCLSDGADVNYEYRGGTCIGIAALYGHVHTLLLLINRGADVHKKDSSSGRNPMHWACVGRHLEVIQLLRQKGLDLHTPKDEGGRTPIYLLKDTDYDVNDDDYYKRRRIECLTALQVDISDTDNNSKDDAEYVKAMAEGGGNLEHLNIVLHGPPGSGKSSLKRAILGEDPLPQVEQNSTGIMENAVRAVSMDRMKNFKVIKDKDLLELLAASMKHCAQQKSSQEQISANVSDTSVAPLPTRIARFFQSIFRVRDISGSTDTSLPSSQQIPDITLQSASAVLSTIRETMKNAKPSSDLFKSKWHHIIDSGGQPHFQDLFPFLYNNSSSFQLLVMRLTDELDEKSKMCFTVEGENALKNGQRLQLTNRQYIEKMCQIAASSNPPSRVMIVGTHKDKLGDNADNKIRELNQALRKDIRKKYGDVLICKNDDQTVFDINTMATGQERKEYTAELQKMIEEVSDKLATSTLVPLQWLAFQLDISNDSGVVKVDDCYKSGRAVGMEVAGIKSALVYFNKSALLLYYPNDIPDLVFTKVDPLVNKLSALVKASFSTPKPILRPLCDKLRNTGVFHRDFLNDVLEGTSPALSNEVFLKLLLCLRIADYIGNNEYFLPSALSLEIPSKQFVYSCVPVGFTWNNCLLPHGFFFTVAIELLGTASDYIFQLSTTQYQCRQEIVFHEKSHKIPGIVKLTDRITWIQVSTTSPTKHCPVIFKSVEKAVHKAIARFKRTITLDSPSVVSICPIHPNSDHYCILSSDNENYTCLEDDSIVESVTPNMLCWMCKDTSTVLNVVTDKSFISAVDDTTLSGLQGGSDLVPILKAIISVVDWHSLGLELGLEKYQLDIIDHDNREKVEDCKKAMISLWLDTDKASWQCLVRALVSPLVDKKDLAVEIDKQQSKVSIMTEQRTSPQAKGSSINESGTPNQSLLTKSPDLHDVHKLLSTHSYKWDDIGRALRVPYTYRIELERERISDDSRLERVLNKWIETESVPVTWDRLIEGLEEIELRVVIRSVKEFLKIGHALATRQGQPQTR